jgi:hypothetical protein
MSVQLWSNGVYSVFPQQPDRADDPDKAESSASARARLESISETEPEPVHEAAGQFERIWSVTPMSETRSICVESAVFEVSEEKQAFTVVLPLAVNVSKITFLFREENLGDSLYIDVGAGSVVGATTDAAEAGDTSVVVTDTAAEALFTGSSIVLDSTRYTVTSTDLRRNTVRFSPALPAAVAEGATTGFSVPIAKGVLITTTGYFTIDVGNRFLPMKCPITVLYSKRGDDKKLSFMTIEYTA